MFGKSPAARGLSGRPDWAQDTAKTEVSGTNGTSTQLRGTSVGRGAPSWLVVLLLLLLLMLLLLLLLLLLLAAWGGRQLGVPAVGTSITGERASKRKVR